MSFACLCAVKHEYDCLLDLKITFVTCEASLTYGIERDAKKSEI